MEHSDFARALEDSLAADFPEIPVDIRADREMPGIVGSGLSTREELVRKAPECLAMEEIFKTRRMTVDIVVKSPLLPCPVYIFLDKSDTSLANRKIEDYCARVFHRAAILRLEDSPLNALEKAAISLKAIFQILQSPKELRDSFNYGGYGFLLALCDCLSYDLAFCGDRLPLLTPDHIVHYTVEFICDTCFRIRTANDKYPENAFTRYLLSLWSLETGDGSYSHFRAARRTVNDPYPTNTEIYGYGYGGFSTVRLPSATP